MSFAFEKTPCIISLLGLVLAASIPRIRMWSISRPDTIPDAGKILSKCFFRCLRVSTVTFVNIQEK